MNRPEIVAASVNTDTVTLSNAEPLNTERLAPAQRAKRVDRACDNCRRKRLKCTVDQHPCMNCVLYHAQCVYTPNQKTRASNNLPKSSSRTKRRRQLSQASIRGRQDIEMEPADLSRRTQVNTEQISSPSDEVAQKGAEQATSNCGDQGIESLPMQNDLIHFEGDLLEGLRMSETDGINGTNMDEFDAVAAELLRVVATRTGAPSSCTSADDAMSHGVLLPQCGDSQTDSQVPDEDGARGVVGLQNFISESRVSDNAAGTESIPPGLMINKDAATGKFIGVTSTGATVASSLKNSIARPGGIQESDVLNYMIGAVCHVDELGLARSASNSDFLLPDRALASQGVNGYFRNIHVLYPILNGQKFLNDWTLLYHPIPPKHDPVFYSRFFMIVAIGLLSQPPTPDLGFSIDELCQELHEKSWRQLHKVLARPYASSVQVILLHVLFLIHFSKSGMAWVLCGLAIRIAQSIGLHREISPDMGLPEEEIRVRSQIWWVCYTLDAFLSATQGRPPAVSNTFCDVKLLPLLKNPNSPGDGVVRPAAEIYFWHVKLAQIENSFCTLFSSTETAASRADKVGELDMALLKWRDEIPMEYRPDQEILADHEMYQTIAMLHLQYFNILRTLHWTSFTSSQQYGFTLCSHSNPRIRSSEAICVASARSFVKILNDMSHELGRERIIPICFHTDHYMAAISILFQNIFKYPQKHSTRADLEVLRAGLYHFERHVHPLRFNDQLKSLFQKIQTVATDLVNKDSSLYGGIDVDKLRLSGFERPHNNAATPGLSLFDYMFSPRFLGGDEDHGGAIANDIPL